MLWYKISLGARIVKPNLGQFYLAERLRENDSASSVIATAEGSIWLLPHVAAYPVLSLYFQPQIVRSQDGIHGWQVRTKVSIRQLPDEGFPPVRSSIIPNNWA